MGARKQGSAGREAIKWLSAIAVSSLMIGTSAGVAFAMPFHAWLTQSESGGAGAQIAHLDLEVSPTATPGYSNGNFAYLENSSQAGGVTPLGNIGCAGDPFGEVSYLRVSTNLGRSPLRVAFSLETQCGLGRFNGTWTWGDGNVSSQDIYNSSYNNGRITYEWWNYTHTYQYVGSFIPQVSIVDGEGKKAIDSRNVYVSFVPSLFYSFYNESGLIGKGINGSADSIGLVESCTAYNEIAQTENFSNDVNAFDHEFGLSKMVLGSNLFFVGPGYTTACATQSSWIAAVETDLDIQWAHVAAPGARIYVYLDNTGGTAPGLYAGMQAFDNARNASQWHTTIVSNSWSVCAEGYEETGSGTALCENSIDRSQSIMETAQVNGVTILSSSGDSWPSKCVEANYPESNPYGLAVGGTTVTGVGSQGSYGSESPWQNLTVKENCTWKVGQKGLARVNFTAGESWGNNTFYPNATWQYLNLSSYRYSPDVSLDANNSTGVPIVYQGKWKIVAGTSLGAPAWAGILDVLFSSNASAHGLLGFAGPFLYSHPGCFHEILLAGGGRNGLGTPNIGCLSRV